MMPRSDNTGTDDSVQCRYTDARRLFLQPDCLTIHISMSIVRRRFTYRGVVQGVGFRPAVYRCAAAARLSGFVQNRRSEVIAEVQGRPGQIDEFIRLFRETLPSAAVLESVQSEEIDAEETGAGPGDRPVFRIIESSSSEYLFPPIPPDLAVCDECRKELLDPADRRYLYPFTTCTQCGPRYSIVEDTPFDRETTSMADFPQCTDCLGEYTNPEDRRFHSQTNSCAACGPKLTLAQASPAARHRGPAGGRTDPADPIVAVIHALREGKIVAMQGIGGFHLAADPSVPGTADRLRREKERRTKPFALMVRDIKEARRLCFFGEAEAAKLRSPESPIIIMPVRPDIPGYLREVSDTGTLGLMLPYTPLHVLLFSHPEAELPYSHLIMTSGNRHSEPIIADPEEAVEKLSGVADLFLYHNRRIIFRNDDSVLRPVLGRPGITAAEDKGFCILRRSRGCVPRILYLDHPIQSRTLALGSDLKNSPALGEGGTVYIAPYIGDLDEQLTFEAFERAVTQVLSLYRVEPERIVCDLHPGYRSTQWAETRWEAPVIKIQHHYAHILSVMAEHGLDECIGAAWDGTGYGTDGTIWGGEFIYATREGFTRLGSIGQFGLPGGESSIYHPRRIAYSLLYGSLDREDLERVCGLFSGTPPAGSLDAGENREAGLLSHMLERNMNVAPTTSAGRLFDAAAALLGFVDEVFYEGEGPIKMEGAAIEAAGPGGVFQPVRGESIEALFPLKTDNSIFTLDPKPLILELAREILTAGGSGSRSGTGAGNSPDRRDEGGSLPNEQRGRLALLFHQAAASALCRGIGMLSEKTGIRDVALSGGVFQNMLLRSLAVPRLEEAGCKVYLNRRVSPGDGCIALGQVYYAGF